MALSAQFSYLKDLKLLGEMSIENITLGPQVTVLNGLRVYDCDVSAWNI